MLTFEQIQEFKIPDIQTIHLLAVIKKVKEILLEIGTSPDIFFSAPKIDPKTELIKLLKENNIEFDVNEINNIDFIKPMIITEFMIKKGFNNNQVSDFLNLMSNKLSVEQLVFKIGFLIIDDIIIDIESQTLRYGYISEQIFIILAEITGISINDLKALTPDSLFELIKRIYLKAQEIKMLAVFFQQMNMMKPKMTKESSVTENT